MPHQDEAHKKQTPHTGRARGLALAALAALAAPLGAGCGLIGEPALDVEALEGMYLMDVRASGTLGGERVEAADEFVRYSVSTIAEDGGRSGRAFFTFEDPLLGLGRCVLTASTDGDGGMSGGPEVCTEDLVTTDGEPVEAVYDLSSYFYLGEGGELTISIFGEARFKNLATGESLKLDQMLVTYTGSRRGPVPPDAP